MRIQFTHSDITYQTDLSQAWDISIPLIPNTEQQVNCFYAPLFEAEPVRMGDFVGSTREGGLLNFLNLRLNPHGNGTHTECVGHIAREVYTINQSLRTFHKPARLISVYPQRQENGDRVIIREQLEGLALSAEVDSLIIRTLPNDESKKRRNYSGSNPPYLHHEAVAYLVEAGVNHLLVDLPSVDREEDEGKLAAHRAFWRYPENIRRQATITELIYVPDELPDGLYLLNLQIASLEIDASPSKPVLYQLQRID